MASWKPQVDLIGQLIQFRCFKDHMLPKQYGWNLNLKVMHWLGPLAGLLRFSMGSDPSDPRIKPWSPTVTESNCSRYDLGVCQHRLKNCGQKGQSKNRMRYMTQGHLCKLKMYLVKPKMCSTKTHSKKEKDDLSNDFLRGSGRWELKLKKGN